MDEQRFFLLPDVAELDALTDGLCQLEEDQFVALIQDIKNQTDVDELKKQVRPDVEY